MSRIIFFICALIAFAAGQTDKIKCKSEVAPEICFFEDQSVFNAQEVKIELYGDLKPKPVNIKRVYFIRTSLPNDFPPLVYITFPNLWLLALQEAGLTVWKQEYLKGATQLKTLYIVDNPIESFDEYAFAEVPRLEELWIEKSKLTAINPNMFKPFNALKELNLSFHNYAQPLEAELFALVKESLVYLDFSGSNINSLPTGMLRDFDNLKVLCLNHIRNFSSPIDASKTLPPSLKKIYVGECSIC